LTQLASRGEAHRSVRLLSRRARDNA
jgi:hypothetical protein